MSGDSLSLTFLVPASDVCAAVKAVESDDMSVVDSAYNKFRDHFLSAISRNNHLEFELRALVKEFGSEKLGYVGEWEEIINCGAPHVAAISGEHLDHAIVGLRLLISELREHPERCLSFLNRNGERYLAEEVADALAMTPPSSFGDAEKAFRSYSQNTDDADDIWTILAFAYAQCSLLEFAQIEGLSVVYAVWLYGLPRDLVFQG